MTGCVPTLIVVNIREQTLSAVVLKTVDPTAVRLSTVGSGAPIAAVSLFMGTITVSVA